MGLLDSEMFMPSDQDKTSARNAALLAAGLGILANNRGRFGEAVGQGGLTGLATYQSALQGQQEEAMRRLKMQQQMNQLAMQQKIGSFFAGAPGQEGTGGMTAGMSQAQKYRQAGDMYAPTDPVKAKAYYEIADKLSPKFSTPGAIRTGPDGEVLGSLPNIEKGVGPDTPDFNRDFTNMAARLAMMEGAKAQATEGVKAGFDPQTITGQDGRPRMMTRAQVVQQATGAPSNGFPRISPEVQAQRDQQAGNMLIGEYGSLEAARGGLAALDKELANKSLQGDARAMLQGQRNRLAAGLAQSQEPQQPGIPLQSEAEKSADTTFATNQAKQKADAVEAAKVAEAYLPQVEKTIDRMKQLGKWATYTQGGQLIDTLARQTGFTTKGAVAREDYIQTARNVLFPQLKATFGAQFTVKEGEMLLETLGDPNKSPSEKDAALESFVQQKKLGINSLRRQAGMNEVPEYEMKGQNPQAQQPVKIKGNDDYNSLPSGSEFIDPLGKRRRKP